MRYPYDNEAISLINRTYSAAADLHLSEYGKQDNTLMALLWYAADHYADWSGDVEHVHETYPLLDRAWLETLKTDHSMSDLEKQVEDCYQQALYPAVDFESKLHLAEVVSNCLLAFQSDGRNVWDGEASIRVTKEFQNDRLKMRDNIHATLSGNAFFDTITVELPEAARPE